MSHAELEDLCAAFALGALDGPDLATLREHLPGCAACRQRVAEFDESATWVALGLPPAQPSAQVKSAVMARIGGQHGQAGGSSSGLGPLGATAMILAALALAAAAASGWLYLDRAREVRTLLSENERLLDDNQALARKAQTVDVVREELARTKRALAAAEQRGAQAVKDLDAARAELERLRRIERLLQDLDTRVFDVTQRLDPAAGDGRVRVLWNRTEIAFLGERLPRLGERTLQLWSMDASGAVTAAGLFKDLRPDGGVVALHTLPAAPGQVAKFAVSLEDADGSSSPTAPEGPVIMISP